MTIEDQPPPVKNDQPASWDLVIADMEVAFQSFQGNPVAKLVLSRTVADMRDRDKLGAERYGVRLQAFNGRKHLIDAYQEALDLAVYLRTDLAEDPQEDVHMLYQSTLNNLLIIRGILMRRDGEIVKL